MSSLIRRQKPNVPSTKISKETLDKTVKYAEYMNSQKEILNEVRYMY